MTGVEILVTQEVATAFGFNWDIFWVVMLVCAFIGIIIGVIASHVEGDSTMFVVVLPFAMILGLVLSGMLGFATEVPVEYETQYKVIVSDEVPMNEFLEKYEIVDQDGKIYVVRERD